MLHPATLLASFILFYASLHAAPMKGYVLAGQWNMQGHSASKTFHTKTDQ
jgi:hypothetical protein